MAAIDEANAEKKFRTLVQTQESIQSLTLWIIHHKAQHEKIVDIWFKVMKKSKMSHRLTLLYLCNDIVQTCKKKHAIIYKDAFKEVLKDAVLLVRDNSVRGNVERIFNIWEERKVYDAAFLEELTAILNNTKVRATVHSRLLAEFKPQSLLQMITQMQEYENNIKSRGRLLSLLSLDTSNIEAVKQLKDRNQGNEFCQDFEDSCTKLETFLGELELGMKNRAALIEMLEQSELFYDTQYGEAKIVTNAYKNFGTRVNNLRRHLEEHRKALPDSMSPVPSPSMDAPSPENTPPSGPTDDILESMDMDLSDDDAVGPPASGPMLPPAVGHFRPPTGTFLAPQPPGIHKATPGPPPWLTTNLPTTQDSQPPGVTNLVQLTEGGTAGAPVNDEGSSTPVQDEKPDANNMSTNPIEFLTQIITQSQKGSVAQSSFFQSLSMLTNSVKSKVQEGPGSSESGSQGPSVGEVGAVDMSTFPMESPLPVPPVFEPWTTTEAVTPSYVPDTRPTPPMPYANAVTGEQPFMEPQSQEYNSTPSQIYVQSQQSAEPYTVDSSLAPAVYIQDKPPEMFPAGQPPYYGVEPPPPPPSEPYSGSLQLDPNQCYTSDNTYMPPEESRPYNPEDPSFTEEPSMSLPPSFIPPPPPGAPPDNPSGSEVPSSYPAPFYQDQGHEGHPPDFQPMTHNMWEQGDQGYMMPPPPATSNMGMNLSYPPPPMPAGSAMLTEPSYISPPGPPPPPPPNNDQNFIPPPSGNCIGAESDPGVMPYMSTPPKGIDSNFRHPGPPDSLMNFNFGAPPPPPPEYDNRFSQQQERSPLPKNDNAPLRGILHRRSSALTTIEPTEIRPTEIEVSSISTITTRIQHPPRPPSQPPSPNTPGPQGSGPPTFMPPRDSEDHLDFIEKLKRKSSDPGTPPAPPKGILKNVAQGIRNLRTLTEVSGEGGPDSDMTDTPPGGDSDNNTEDSQMPALLKSLVAQSMEQDMDRHQDQDMMEPHVPRHRSRDSHRGPDGPPFRPDLPPPPFRRDMHFGGGSHRGPPRFHQFREPFHRHDRPFPKRPPHPPFDMGYRRFPPRY